MIQIILFILAVVAWDGLKKALRGKKSPKVSMRRLNIVKAQCGCSIEDGKIANPCAAHELLLKL